MHTYLSSLFWISFHLGHREGLSRAPVLYSRFSLAYFLHRVSTVYMYQSPSLSSLHYVPLGIHTFVLCLYFCLADKVHLYHFLDLHMVPEVGQFSLGSRGQSRCWEADIHGLEQQSTIATTLYFSAWFCHHSGSSSAGGEVCGVKCAHGGREWVHVELVRSVHSSPPFRITGS